MPLLVHCDELQTNMRLAEAFLLFGRMMLPGGKVLTIEDIDILQRKYPEMTFKVVDPLLDSVVEFEDDGKEREVAATATQGISQCMSQVQERFSSRTALASINFNAMRNAAASVIDFLRNNPVTAAMITRSGKGENYLNEHAGNVFYLALVLGSAVRDYVMRERMRQTAASHLSSTIAMDLLPLGLGAMMMDVGMYELQHLYKPGYELTEADRKAIREHPNAGCEMLPESLPAGVKMVVRTHHENLDGTGYPAGMAGESQHIFTRIVRICDAYEAATAEKVYRSAKSPVRVIWEMSAGSHRKFYDPVLMKMFRSLIQPFPIGAKLKLTDGRTAVVVRYNRKEPFQPTVMVAFDEKGERLAKEELRPPVHLGEDNEMRIASFNGEDLSYLNTEPVAAAGGAGEFGDVLAAAYP